MYEEAYKATDQPGVYALRVMRQDAGEETRRFAGLGRRPLSLLRELYSFPRSRVGMQSGIAGSPVGVPMRERGNQKQNGFPKRE